MLAQPPPAHDTHQLLAASVILREFLTNKNKDKGEIQHWLRGRDLQLVSEGYGEKKSGGSKGGGPKELAQENRNERWLGGRWPRKIEMSGGSEGGDPGGLKWVIQFGWWPVENDRLAVASRRGI